MRQRRIGSYGFAVGAVGLGCMPLTGSYGGPTRDETTATAVVHTALDLGSTLVDTADVYGPYANEMLVGKALAGRRAEAVLATKVGLVRGPDGQPLRDARPEHIRAACDHSLRRLDVDVIDLYQLHRVDPQVPLEESVGALADLVHAGKARAIGLSEVGVAQVVRAQAVFPITTVQSELSLWTRDHLDVVDTCARHGIGFLAFAPLGRGFLAGTLPPGSTFEPGDFRARHPRFSVAALDANQKIVGHVRQVCAKHDATPAQVALAWVLAQGPHVVPIPGTTSAEHVRDNAGAADLDLDAEDLAVLDALPAPVGARY